MGNRIAFELGFYGADAADAEIDLYDIAQAMIGFQRSLALTTHLIIHDEIITQAPSLKDASIFAATPEPGSWKLPAYLAFTATALYKIGTAPHDTPLGHLVYSGYDYVVNQSLGFRVDFDKSLGQQYEELERNGSEIPKLKEYRFDSLIEKCETSIRDIHRPLYGRGTAEKARIKASPSGTQLQKLGSDLTLDTYEYVRKSIRNPVPEQMMGSVSSYNNNTYRGRIFVPETGFPVPFTLTGNARSSNAVSLITGSLVANAQRRETGDEGLIYFYAHRVTSKNGRLKKLEITAVSGQHF